MQLVFVVVGNMFAISSPSSTYTYHLMYKNPTHPILRVKSRVKK